MPGVSINADTDSLKRFAMKLRKANPEVYKALQKRIREAGQIVADEARKNADFSEKVQKRIRVRASGNRATVSASGLLPVGFETGKTPKGNRWRHPGNWPNQRDDDQFYGASPPMGTGKDGTQGPRPWLKPAADSKGEQAKALIIGAVEQAIDDTVKGVA